MKSCYVLLFMTFFSCGTELVFSGPMGNLALKKPVAASPPYSSDTTAGKANDGDIAAVQGHYASQSGGDPFWRVDLLDFYVVTTVEIVLRLDGYFDHNDVVEVRVGGSLENEGNSNPLCGEPTDLDNLSSYVFRCELYGRYVNVKKNVIPASMLVIQEVLVNKEPTTNMAFGKTTSHSSRYKVASGSDKAVDGTIQKFNSHSAHFPHWCMIDFGATIPIVKIFLMHNHRQDRLNKIIVAIGDSSTDHGKDNPRLGGVHDFSEGVTSFLYSNPRIAGRYATFESLLDGQMALNEIEVYSESMPFIAERINGLGSHSYQLFNGYQKVLLCHWYGYPPPYIAWVSNGVVLQNRSSDTNLVVTGNETIGTETKYECRASNIHGKDLYVITATHVPRYHMCVKPTQITDPTRNRLSKQDTKKAIKDDKNSFNATKMYSFFNSQSSLYMKLTTTCPAPSSCGTDAPGWLPDGHPKPEDGIVRRKVCFHYNGDCCYKELYIDVINCPGMFVYGLLNTVFNFSARYCFEDDKTNEAFLPFKSVPRLFAPVGGSNTALVNHVIEKFHGIEDTAQCMTVCMMNKCRSLNFDKLEKICEVSDATRDEYPRDLTTKPGFKYYHPMGQSLLINKGPN